MAAEIERLGTDEAARFVRRLHSEHGSALYGWALRRLGDPLDAEEVVAESLVKAWNKHSQFDPERGTERAWLFGILRNAATDHHRGQARHLRLITEGSPSEEGTDSGIEAMAESTVVREALLDLSDEHREVIVEAYFAGRSVSQISARVGIPPGTVKSRLYYGMRNLRTALEERGILG